MRIVLHVDLDSFYAQAEELRRPELRGKPVVIGMYSGRTETSGAVATANYPARKLGIHSGMNLATALRKADKETVFLKADRPYYLEVSGRVMDVFREFADAFEQVSIDEASLEVTERCNEDFSKAELLAKRLKEAIKRKEKLTCSVGIGPNKLLAKMAAGMRKPDGLTAVRPEGVDGFLEPLPVGKLYGLGPKSEEALAAIGVRTVKQLKALRLEKLTQLFGPAKGRWFF
ncbi:MAG TPA: DNA polymerase IV, partial [archaeon]|nr:DNA polymerase IV [archaeon]